MLVVKSLAYETVLITERNCRLNVFISNKNYLPLKLCGEIKLIRKHPKFYYNTWGLVPPVTHSPFRPAQSTPISLRCSVSPPLSGLLRSLTSICHAWHQLSLYPAGEREARGEDERD